MNLSFNRTKGFIIFLLICFCLGYLIRFIFERDSVKYTSKISFSKDVYDFGKIIRNQEVDAYFVYVNSGENPLIINNITSSCGCTIPNWSKYPLEVGATDSLLIKFDAKTLGYFFKIIYVFSNSEKSPSMLTVKGFVKNR